MTIHTIMRRSFLPLSMICLVILPSLLHAQAFEGEIRMQMSSPMMGSQKIDALYSIKGDKVLQSGDDPKAGKVDVYTDLTTGTQIIVQEAQKQGMEVDQADVDSAIKKMKMPMLVPTASGKKEKIAGYNCEIYTMPIDSAEELDLWLTQDLPKDVSAAIDNCTVAGMKSTGVKSDVLMTLFHNGYAEVKLEMKRNGVTQFTNIFIKAERKKLNDSLFVVSSDIKVSKYDPSMMRSGDNGK